MCSQSSVTNILVFGFYCATFMAVEKENKKIGQSGKAKKTLKAFRLNRLQEAGRRLSLSQICVFQTFL